MTDPTAIAQRLYDAFAARDGEALLAAMTEDFVGTVSAGMPLGVGGRHEGRDAMLRDCWAQVFMAYDMAVEADRYLVCAPDEVVVLGSYRGTERATRRRGRRALRPRAHAPRRPRGEPGADHRHPQLVELTGALTVNSRSSDPRERRSKFFCSQGRHPCVPTRSIGAVRETLMCHRPSILTPFPTALLVG